MFYYLFVVLLIEIVLTCLIPPVTGYFFNKLSVYSPSAWSALFIYLGLRFGLDFIQNLKPYVITLYSNIKREVLTNTYLAIPSTIPNREQRIQEDIKLHVVNSISVYSEYFISFAIVVVLIAQNISQPLLIGSSIGYSLLCIASAALFKPLMIRAEKHIQIAEAQFRDEVRLKKLLHCLVDVLLVNKTNALVKFKYGLCVRVQSGLMLLLPYLVLLPAYLNKTISLGYMMEQSSIFALLVLNMSIIVNMYPTLMQSMASKHRMNEMEK